MIPSISAQTPIEQQTQKVGYKLTSLYNNIESLQNLFFGECVSVKDITDQIPLWVIYEKDELASQGLPSTSIFDFLQKYYDWLYCDTENGSQYELAKNLLNLVDIEKTKTNFAHRLAGIYAHGIDPKAYAENGGKIDIESVKNFVHNIRKNFHQKKTTIDGIRYFFKTLFDIPEEMVKIEYPKKYLLRLNGGRFYNENFTFPGETGSYEILQSLSGSCLNFSRMQDSNFYQDYSYLLKVGIKSSYYKETYKTLAHPAGLKVIFEKTLEDYVGPEEDYDFSIVCERPFLKNYTPYQPFGAYTDVIGACGGVTYYGLNYCYGCSGFGGFTGPTHAFPNWNSNPAIVGYSFQNIMLKDFFDICYDNEEIVSPNVGLTCSTCIAEET